MAGSRAPGPAEGVAATPCEPSDGVRAGTGEPFPTGTLLDGKFRVAAVLGTGSRGAVYEIVHEETRKRRALRVLEGSGDDVDDALRQATTAGSLRHPHLVEVFETGRLERGSAYILMELLEGVPLAQRIRETGGLAVEELGEVLGQACEGVQVAHEAGIVHGDLRAQKLFITSGAGRPLVKVLDFGVARLVASGSVARGHVAPELQADPAAADERTDVHALGVILYEAVAGKPPTGPEASPLDQVRTRLPSTLAELASAAISADRERRPPTARALGDALRVIVRDASVDPLGKTLPVTDGHLSPLAIAPPPPRARVADAPAARAAASGAKAARVTTETAGNEPAVPSGRDEPSAPALVAAPRRRRASRLTAIAVVLLAAALATVTALLLHRLDPKAHERRPAPTAPG